MNLPVRLAAVAAIGSAFARAQAVTPYCFDTGKNMCLGWTIENDNITFT